MSNPEMSDTERYTEICSSCVDYGEEFELHIKEGGVLLVSNKQKLPLPSSGDEVTFYGKGFGYTVRGVMCGEHVYYYKSKEDYEHEQKVRLDDSKKKRVRDFEENKEKFYTEVNALPLEFQTRVNYFLSGEASWKYDFGPYELFTCQEAVKIANTLKTDEKITEFYEMTVDEQRAAVPDLDMDEHSGNTFGTACFLARVFISKPEMLWMHHGALCPLVGCENYGCWASRDGKKDDDEE